MWQVPVRLLQTSASRWTGALLAVGLCSNFRAMKGPDWIKRAERVALAFRSVTVGGKGAGHSVYVILLHDPSKIGRWGLYVGQTSRDPDVRFDQHKSGYKASGAVRRFGVKLLPDLVDHLNPMRDWESLEIEAALAGGFRNAGIQWVEGGH